VTFRQDNKMDGIPLDDDTLQRLYAWIDEIPLSRPKKNIARDFSDGILTAEVIGYYFPKFVQMHNYSSANSAKQKEYNWNTLNRKVLKKLKIFLTKQDIDDIVTCRPGSVERMLVKLQLRIANFHEKRMSSSGNGKRDHTASDSEDEEVYYNVEKASESREPQLQDASLATTGRDNVVMLSPTNGMDMPQQPKYVS
jgi:hypothetical protein